nr:double zinc ribbon and ankyrin repeat-containing protein 1 isoform X1 [Nothobranchius furzeri]
MAAGAVLPPLIIPIIYLPTHRAKKHIDTTTPVSIQSDSAGVLIFYTLDGSKPELGQRGAAGSSRKYTEPILLPAGRVSVKAVAVTSDGRQSSVVTKVFSVVQLDSGSTVENQNSLQNHLKPDGTCDSAEKSLGSPQRSVELTVRGQLGSKTPSTTWISSSQTNQTVDSYELKQMNSTEATRVQRQTNFLRCARCLSARPSDPFARFCTHCGEEIPQLPSQRLPPAEGGQMLLCVSCKSMVPANTPVCLVCEAPIDLQLQPKASLSPQDHVVCVSCGSGNPPHVSSCLACENHLQQTMCGGNSTPSVLAADQMLSCSRCERLNRSDARFCDWCGSKPTHLLRCVTCCRCGASGHPYAFYCACCGSFLKGPDPPTSFGDVIQPITCTTTNQSPARPSLSPTPKVKITLPSVDQSTQTVGLYFPSATELQRKKQQIMLEEVTRRLVTRVRCPPVTAISPGRGYWRQQLDHVCANLRSYAQNNAPFRAVLGEPRLGRVVSAVLQEDPHEVSLTITFVSAGQKEQQVGSDDDCGEPSSGGPGPVGQTETLSRVTEQSADSTHLRGDQLSGMIKPKLNQAPTPAMANSQLLKELGQGRGRISIIQQLLDQGADPSCCESRGRHALVVAVRNGHHDLLPVLVQRGANVNQQSGPMKNTALHEAAALGSDGLQSAELLLRCKASVTQKNAAGLTASDMAMSSGCSELVSLMAARTGLDFLDKLGRS